MKLREPAALILVSAALLTFGLGSCRATLPNRDPVGEVFPSAAGQALDGSELALPGDLSGAPAVLLLGYVQDAQFDADRWLYGLLQADLPVRILEVPTLPGLFPRMLSGTIDSGMRSGIPDEDWQSVVTLYGDGASEVVEFTGNETPRNIRVLLLDREGRVLWHHDRGFSAGKLIELEERVRELASGDPAP